MDIEDLSKSQLLLLMILVNFVVSIATGVLTVSLLNQAPTTVTQTVNRIVDHTIETVTTQVPAITGKPAPSTEDLLTSAIAADAARTVTISYSAGATTPSLTGVYSSVSHTVYTIGQIPEHVTITFPNGTSAEASQTGTDGSLLRYSFAPGASLPDAPAANPVAIADLKSGQTAIALAADGSAVTGIVTKVSADGIAVDLPGVPAGAAVVNLSGNVIGLFAGGGVLIPGDRLSALAAAP